MKNILNIFLIALPLVFLTSCEEEQFDSSLTYVAFGDSTYSTGVDEGGSATVTVDVFTSTIAGSDLTFKIDVDSDDAAPGSFNVPATVTVPAGSNKGSFQIGLSDTDLGIGINKLVLSFTDVITGYDNGDETTIEYFQNCTEVIGTLVLSFDRWGSEVSWDIKDSLGGVVLSGGGYSDGPSGSSTTDTIDITLCDNRSYTLNVKDSFGDGWGSVGSYTLTIEGEVKASGDGDLGDGFGETIAFDTL